MTVQSAQSVTALFSTRVFATGVGTNADSLPTGTLYLNGTANGATVTVANITTGLYKAQVTMPTLAIGDEVELVISATVSTIADKAVIWGDTKDFIADANGFATANLNGDLTATMKTSVTTAATAATPTAAAVTGAVGSVTGNIGGSVASVTGNIGGNVTGSVGSVTGLTASDVAAIKSKTDQLAFTVAGQVDANAESMNATTILGNGTSGNLWRG